MSARDLPAAVLGLRAGRDHHRLDWRRQRSIQPAALHVARPHAALAGGPRVRPHAATVLVPERSQRRRLLQILHQT